MIRARIRHLRNLIQPVPYQILPKQPEQPKLRGTHGLTTFCASREEVNEAVRMREVGCIVYIYIYILFTYTTCSVFRIAVCLACFLEPGYFFERVRSTEARDSQMSSNGVLCASRGCSGCSGCIWLYLVVFGCAELKPMRIDRFCVKNICE